MYRIKKLKSGQGPTKGYRATIIIIIIMIIIIIVINILNNILDSNPEINTNVLSLSLSLSLPPLSMTLGSTTLSALATFSDS
jgi:hypothetical protein